MGDPLGNHRLIIAYAGRIDRDAFWARSCLPTGRTGGRVCSAATYASPRSWRDSCLFSTRVMWRCSRTLNMTLSSGPNAVFFSAATVSALGLNFVAGRGRIREHTRLTALWAGCCTDGPAPRRDRVTARAGVRDHGVVGLSGRSLRPSPPRGDDRGKGGGSGSAAPTQDQSGGLYCRPSGRRHF